MLESTVNWFLDIIWYSINCRGLVDFSSDARFNFYKDDFAALNFYQCFFESLKAFQMSQVFDWYNHASSNWKLTETASTI